MKNQITPLLSLALVAGMSFHAFAGVDFSHRPLTAGRASLAETGYVESRSLGVARMAPELTMPAEGRRQDRGRRGGEEGPRILRAILRVGGRRRHWQPRGGRQLDYQGKEVPRWLDVLLFGWTPREDHRSDGTHGGLLLRRRRTPRRGLAGRHGVRLHSLRRRARQVGHGRRRDDDAFLREPQARDSTSHEGRQGGASGQASTRLGEARLA